MKKYILLSLFIVFSFPLIIPQRAYSADLSILKINGIGPIQVGMTLAEAEKVSGVKLPAIQKEMNDCVYVAPNGDKKEIILMVYKNKIIRADVPTEGFTGHKSTVKTPEGIGVGDSLQKVMNVYKGRVKKQRHPYGQEGKDFYLLVSPKDSKNKKYLMIFEIMEGKVQSFRSGFSADVQAIEGCA